eukprot:1536377-Pyramimonas_sp.AAC.1
MGSYTKLTRPVRYPIQKLYGLLRDTEPAWPVWDPIQSPACYGILRKAFTPCMGSYTDPTRPVRDPVQSLHGLCGIVHRAYTPCVGSYTEPERLVWD